MKSNHFYTLSQTDRSRQQFAKSIMCVRTYIFLTQTQTLYILYIWRIIMHFPNHIECRNAKPMNCWKIFNNKWTQRKRAKKSESYSRRKKTLSLLWFSVNCIWLGNLALSIDNYIKIIFINVNAHARTHTHLPYHIRFAHAVHFLISNGKFSVLRCLCAFFCVCVAGENVLTSVSRLDFPQDCST